MYKLRYLKIFSDIVKLLLEKNYRQGVYVHDTKLSIVSEMVKESGSIYQDYHSETTIEPMIFKHSQILFSAYQSLVEIN
jgi:hypothetical protein